MKEFILAALPWVIMGISVAVLVVNRKKTQGTVDTYITEGMCLGMCAGTVLGSMDVFNMGLGISLGMLVGEAIGYCIKK